MKKWLAVLGSGTLLAVMGLLITMRIAFGGGEAYPDLTTLPTLPQGSIEAAVQSDRPIGNAAVAADGRVFYTIHPESNPDYPKLYVSKDGQSSPFPASKKQAALFNTPLGVTIDQQNRLWVIDPANHGTGQPALIAFDIDSGESVHRFEFASAVAPVGSFLQDHQVSSDGKWVYIADVGFWTKSPAIIVYDVEQGIARRVLNEHKSLYPQNYLIRTQIRDMSYLGGILEMKTGIDGIALSRDDQWLYYAAMNHTSMFRIPTSALQDSGLSDTTMAASIENVGNKPLNDGLSIDRQGNVFITDVEHQAVVKMTPQGELETIVKDSRIRWADGLSFGPDGWLYLADSAIPHLVLQSPDYIASQAPFYIWRFKPGTTGAAGQ